MTKNYHSKYFLYDVIPSCYERTKIVSMFKWHNMELPKRIYLSNTTKHYKVVGQDKEVVSLEMVDILLDDIRKRIAELKHYHRYKGSLKRAKQLREVLIKLLGVKND